jgi:uncharacterized protein YdiU (UPF0061 family)
MLLRSASSSSHPKRKLDLFGQGENSIRKYLTEDKVELKDGSQHFPRQVRKAHFTSVLPEPVPRPHFVAASGSCAEMLNLDPSETKTSDFAAAFGGNKLLPGLDKPYATVYGCHSYGRWFGQLGDGRALSLGEVYTAQTNRIDDMYSTNSAQLGDGAAATKSCGSQQGQADHHYSDHIMELQLKGCGRSPYSRGFDGRAVLRSSVREFLGTTTHRSACPTLNTLYDCLL